MTETIIRSSLQVTDTVTDESTANFEALYREQVNFVYRYLAVRIGNPHDVQDLTAQTFLAALESQQRSSQWARPITSIRGWLLGIARHKVAAFYRESINSAPLDAAFDVPDPAPLPDVRAMHTLRLDQVARVMQAIAPDRAEAIALCFFGGLTFDEAATVMGRSRDAVKMLVHRGITDLRLRLNPVQEEV